ncbi:hypothetical protein AAMO2058_001581200, partial [Amorphochlora amoebiformis]
MSIPPGDGSKPPQLLGFGEKSIYSAEKDYISNSLFLAARENLGRFRARSRIKQKEEIQVGKKRLGSSCPPTVNAERRLDSVHTLVKEFRAERKGAVKDTVRKKQISKIVLMSAEISPDEKEFEARRAQSIAHTSPQNDGVEDGSEFYIVECVTAEISKRKRYASGTCLYARARINDLHQVTNLTSELQNPTWNHTFLFPLSDSTSNDKASPHTNKTQESASKITNSPKPLQHGSNRNSEDSLPVLRLGVWAHNPTSALDKIIGEALIPICEFPAGQAIEGWFPLMLDRKQRGNTSWGGRDTVGRLKAAITGAQRKADNWNAAARAAVEEKPPRGYEVSASTINTIRDSKKLTLKPGPKKGYFGLLVEFLADERHFGFVATEVIRVQDGQSVATEAMCE